MSDKHIAITPEFLKSLEQEVIDIAEAAGHAILTVYAKGFTVTNKSDSTPVTDADMAAHDVIKTRLSAMTYDFPVLSEEAPIPLEDRAKWPTYWLIDPLDGTKEFIKKNGEFGVNIALIHHNQPVLGVVHAPVLKKTYFASKNNGAFKILEHNPAEKISTTPKQSPMRLTCSRSHISDRMQGYLKPFGEHTCVPMGSSLKSCLVAEGKADLYPRLGKTSEWDTGACQIIVQEAGGEMRTLDNQALTYNQRETTINPEFIVFGDVSFDWFSPIKKLKNA